jgi:acetyl-CoA C-acetyltransferase
MAVAFILDGLRTPFGNFGGAFKDLHPTELGRIVTGGLLKKTGTPPDAIAEVFFGNVLPADSSSIYLARHIALGAGLPVETPALTVNRLCGSGMEAVVQAAQGILLGRFDLALAGGVESMSSAPYLATGARWGNRLGTSSLEDALLEGLTDRHVNLPMGCTAENLAADFEISREAQDEYAARSQTLTEAARDAGRLAAEILPVSVPARKADVLVEHDEFIRGKAGSAGLAKLRPAFQNDGTVTAGNASGINDGASVTLIASKEAAGRSGLRPLAKIAGFGVAGCAPDRMGIGPAFAIPRALNMAGLELKDMDLIEINEAFAAQYLAVEKTLGLDRERTNVNGGAIALGHPLGASGNRVLLTLCKELERRGGRYGVASLCIGGGQGIAMVVERADL